MFDLTTDFSLRSCEEHIIMDHIQIMPFIAGAKVTVFIKLLSYFSVLLLRNIALNIDAFLP